MTADAPPNDVSLSRANLFAVLKGCATIVVEGHLEDSISAPYAFDSEASSEAVAVLNVLDELRDRYTKRCSRLACQPTVIARKRRRSIESWQLESERLQKFVSGVESLDVARPDVAVRFLLARNPGIIPEPSLFRILLHERLTEKIVRDHV